MSTRNIQRCSVVKLETTDYKETWELQQMLVQARRRECVGEVFLLTEHQPTYTIGKSGREEHLLVEEGALLREGIPVYRVERGGDITYHGPGQLVGYPILDLRQFGRDVHLYLRNLEEVLIQTVGAYGPKALRVPGMTGVWVEGRKIAAIGVHVRHWITMHGFALNVDTDLRYFSRIVPCGIRGREVTSLEALLSRKIDRDEVAEQVIHHFSEIFGVRTEGVEVEYLKGRIMEQSG